MLDVGCFLFSFFQPGVIVAGFVHIGADAEMRARPVEIERHDDVPRNAERLHQFRDQLLGLLLAFAQQEALDVQRINNQVAGGGHNFCWSRDSPFGFSFLSVIVLQKIEAPVLSKPVFLTSSQSFSSKGTISRSREYRVGSAAANLSANLFCSAIHNCSMRTQLAAVFSIPLDRST